MKQKRTASAGRNSLRIIAGVWRGRRVSFPDVPGLRPTPDRVRETVFNWLQPVVVAQDCLDLYAGSGACGLEALSRGARSVTFVDAAAQATRQLQQNLDLLAQAPGYSGQSHVVHARAEQWLAAQAAEPRFGLVFLDPPFADDVLAARCCQLENSGLLQNDAWIYVESGAPLPVAAGEGDESFPANWLLRKQGRAGAVHFGLYKRHGANSAPSQC